MDRINGFDKRLACFLGNKTQSETIAPPTKPTPPSEYDTFRDELGIEIFKTPVINDDTIQVLYCAAKPLSIHPELASHIRTINGKRICYYNKQNAELILNQILNKYPANADEFASYNILGNLALGNRSRDCFQINVDDGQYIKGELITTYPNMGYYIHDEWKNVEIGINYRKASTGLALVEMTDDMVPPKVTSDDVAFPIAPVLLIPKTK